MTSEQKAITFLMIAIMNLIMIIMKMELNMELKLMLKKQFEAVQVEH